MSVKPGEKSEFEDPLDFKIPEGEFPSTLSRIPRSFTITTDSYIFLCSRVYAAFCYQHADFAESVSESAFQCYATFLLWKRFANILPVLAKSGDKFWREILRLVNYRQVPVPLYTYLRGIGHFCDPHGFERQFILPIRSIHEQIGGVSYTFGKVSAESHYLYEAFSAPGISVLRMLADIKYTNDKCEKNRIWDLPPELRPDEARASDKPTKNLLGWAPAQSLRCNAS